jgi:hypothetical protein
MRAVLALLLTLASLSIGAADARRYAVLSLIGDRLLISQYVPATGSRTDTNVREWIQLEDPTLEKTSLLAIHQALKKLDPDSKPVLLFAQDGRIYTGQEKMLDEGGSSLHMLEYVRGLLKGQDVTHLILVTKLRHAAQIQLARSTIGSGMLEGLGFYVDPYLRVINPTTLDFGRGLVGPFAYFKVSLVDLTQGTVVTEERVVASTSAGVAEFKDGSDPWAGLSAETKVKLLQGLIRNNMARVIPLVVKQ